MNDKILADFRGFKYIQCIKNISKNNLIAAMRGKDGNIVISRLDTANMFADFYDQLFAANGSYSWRPLPVNSQQRQAFRPFRAAEVTTQVQKMANGKLEGFG